MKKPESIVEMIKRIVKEESDINYQKELSFFLDPDYVPDSEEVIKSTWPEPHRTKALKLLKQRKSEWGTSSANRKKQWK